MVEIYVSILDSSNSLRAYPVRICSSVIAFRLISFAGIGAISEIFDLSLGLSSLDSEQLSGLQQLSSSDSSWITGKGA